MQRKQKTYFSGHTLCYVEQVVLKNAIVLKAPYSMFTNQQFTALLQTIVVFHQIGRWAFPIFCFLLVEGFLHILDLKQYLFHFCLFGL